MRVASYKITIHLKQQTARVAFGRKKIDLFPIPPRSPDINIIENLFNAAKRKLSNEAKDRGLRVETLDDFKQRIESMLENFPNEYINNLIDSLPKRTKSIIATKGIRLKY